MLPLKLLMDNTNSSKDGVMLVGTSPAKLLLLRFKLLSLSKELNWVLTSPLKELKDKSRTSRRGKPEKLLRGMDSWLLLRLSDRNPAFMEQEEVKNCSIELVKEFLERSRICKVSREHMVANMVELDKPYPDKVRLVTTDMELELEEQLTPSHRHGFESLVFHLALAVTKPESSFMIDT
ncbi:Os12g0182333 [Oryza sativa Japonica Group]|uniref:Os12g0182333 protein n=1 Tax=Oryza sativa subsp. japonica TaxID=39947 RepID=A0A0P0Y7P1_ORYSJ|nr:hypothetical protein EE612_058191 [Oryza sativa]BAT16159.1 Os12g0182333 [Oryza sativa Japonica Group]